MVYNLSILGNSTGMLGLTQNVNTELMFGYFGILLLSGIGFIIFSGFYWNTRKVSESMTATLFILFVLSVLFKAMGLISSVYIFIVIVALALSTALTWRSG